MLEFSKLLEVFFPEHRQRLIDALNPVMEAFDTHALMDTMRPHVDRFWDKQIHIENEGCLVQLMDIFSFPKDRKSVV